MNAAGRLVLVALCTVAAVDAAQGQSRRDRRNRDGDAVDRSTPATPSTAPAQTAPAGAPGQVGAGRSARMEDQFGILLERSIFARSGVATRSDRTPATSTAPAAPPLSPEQAVVFVGVLAQDSEFVAFAENQVTRQLTVLRTGDDVARGRVVAITLDTLAYASGGNNKVIHLGPNLAGEAGSSSFASSGATVGSSTTAPSSTANLSPELQSVAEKMRARARQSRGE